MNKYPIYVISKDRHDCCLTANFLVEEGVDFKIVVEPQQKDLYAEKYGEDRLLILPFSNLGLGGIPARNWVWEHSKAAGYERHWILDDNIRSIARMYKGKRIRCKAVVALKAAEDFTERYQNIAISGLNYMMFVTPYIKTPFHLNCRVYSCLLIKNDLPVRWRGRYNEDTDLCLQVLALNFCTILFNVFCIEKIATGTMKGGNATELYKGDGRLKMANALKRNWPYIVEVKRRFQRPQHVVKKSWKNFDTPLKFKEGTSIEDYRDKNEYGLKIKLLRKPKNKSNQLSKIIDEFTDE